MPAKKKRRRRINNDNKANRTEVAIIGMACRLAGSNNYNEYWLMLQNGQSQVREVTKDHWDVEKYYSSEFNAPHKNISKWAGLLNRIDTFDASFFDISPRESRSMDPQHRLLLEETWHCIEDANVTLEELQQHNTSVYVGIMAGDYQHHLFKNYDNIDGYSFLCNYEGISANRISYFLNLTGESLSIDAACASSVVAIDHAANSIRSEKSKYAFAAGVSMITHVLRHISFSNAHMLSPDGLCKTFDAAANGYVPGEGVGVLLLTSLENALEKGYHIYGILKGSAVHHGGKTSSLTAPSITAERSVISDGIANSHVSPETITYLEAHGTGTSLGDPIEVEALTQAFYNANKKNKQSKQKKQYCYIGSVKTNIGHLEAAAGIAGIIKVLLMFKHKQIPQTLNVTHVNPMIDFENSPFRLADKHYQWQLPPKVSKRRAGINSFGFGGVLSHAILEEYEVKDEKKKKNKDTAKLLPFLLSAKSKVSLHALLNNWRDYLTSYLSKDVSIDDICHTLMFARKTYPFRFAAAVENKQQIIEAIDDFVKQGEDFIDTNVNLVNKNIILTTKTVTMKWPQFLSAMKQFPILANLYHSCEQEIASLNNGNKIIKEIHTGKSKKAQLLRNFLTLYVINKALLTSGLQPDYVTGDNLGELVEVVVSGMLDFTSVFAWLLDNHVALSFKQPKYGIYDKRHQKTIETYHADELYCKNLLDQIDLDEKIYSAVLNKSMALQEHQHTFKRFLAEWEDIFKQHHISINSLVAADASRNQRTRTLIFIALMVCIQKLNKKWQLSEKINVNNPAINEIIDLLLDNVISYQSIANLLMQSGDMAFRLIIELIDKNKQRIDPNKPYALLKDQNKLTGITQNASRWLTELLDTDVDTNDYTGTTQKENWFIELGGKNLFTHPNKTCLNLRILEDSFVMFLTELWLKGIPIEWQGILSESGNLVPGLPGYPFQQDRYWFPEENTIVQVEKNNNNEKIEKIEKAEKVEKIEKSITPIVSEPVSVKVELQTKEPTAESILEVTDMRQATIEYLSKIIAEVTSVPINHISPHDSFDKFGIDSIMIYKLNHVLEQHFDKLPAVLFFQYRNINDLAHYLFESHYPSIEKLFQTSAPQTIQKSKKSEQLTEAPKQAELEQTEKPKITTEETEETIRESVHTSINHEDIAIIGVSGKFPLADNIVEFWENLCDARNCITEVPKERWDYQQYYAEIKDKLDLEPGKIYCKWGGFINDIDKFDATFFNISPADTQYMDPQERLFLQTVWSCIESSGHTPQDLNTASRVGCFVGVSFNNFQLLQKEQKGEAAVLNSQSFSVANRVSYYFNFNGPSFSVDTACSSSLYALHLACESIRAGECQLAVAGGANLSLHPSKYAMLCAHGFAATDGICHSFGEGGDGYVPGEAIAAVLLKPLSLAIKDGDTIYGVIKGTAVSHGGKTMGYTVPNPTQQAAVVALALQKAEIDPRTISYVEAHGTGTSLGDPIEISGLTDVYSKNNTDKQYCAIGSVKSNIGHSEASAGIAQLVKVLLQLKNKQIVPTLLHNRKLNPNIDFANTPFYVQHTLGYWKKPELSINGVNTHIPRRAGVSSFGAGGANVHVIVEEFVSPETRQEINQATIIPLSAKGPEQLQQIVKSLLAFLQRYKGHNPVTGEPILLSDLAYTLQLGRESFPYRCAIIANHIDEVITQLSAITQFASKVDTSDIPAITSADDLTQIAQKWVKGATLDWQRFYTDTKGKAKRIYLPSYAFLKTRYWPRSEANTIKEPVKETSASSEIKSSQAVTQDLPKAAAPVAKHETTTQLAGNSEFLHSLADLLEHEQYEHMMKYCQQELADVLGFNRNELKDPNVGFFELGMESMQGMKFHRNLQNQLGITIPDTALFDYPNVAKLAHYILSLIPFDALNQAPPPNPVAETVAPPPSSTRAEENKENNQSFIADAHDDDIAVVGMSCRFPGGSDTPEKFWEFLQSGTDPVAEIPKERFDGNTYFDSNKDASGKIYVREGAFLSEDVSKFDAQFFGISPREAADLDPQQRMLLELSWEALESAAIIPAEIKESRTGVFIGLIGSDYGWLPRDNKSVGPYTLTGVLANLASGRIAHHFGFHGPAVTIDTACSSSLVSTHLACESLKNRECDIALCGGINIMVSPFCFIMLCKVKALAPDGRCKSFDESADGYGRGEGGGILVLKRLSDAIKARDQIFAVIKGSSVNQDGPSSGLTVPNGVAQRALLSETLSKAKVKPDEIDYIETHGTGTPLGDPIEIGAITDVYKERQTPLYLGTVKSNVGHLEAAAGVVALIKGILCLNHKMITPNLHLKKLNPRINLNPIHGVIPQAATNWESNKKRHFATSSFGFSGTNAHAILSEGMVHAKDDINDNIHVLTLSAHNDSVLKQIATNYLNYMQANPNASLSDIIYTANTGRSTFSKRAALVTYDKTRLQKQLQNLINDKGDDPFTFINDSAAIEETEEKVAFMFSDSVVTKLEQFKIYYERNKYFRETLDECAKLLSYQSGQALLSNDETLTTKAQLKLFAIEYAMAHSLMKAGIQPGILFGQGMGAVVAACVAGVMTPATGIALIEHANEPQYQLNQNDLSAPQLSIMSYDGRQMKKSEIMSPLYWQMIMTQKVNHPVLLHTLYEQDFHYFIEIGGGDNNLIDLTRQLLIDKYNIKLFPVCSNENSWETFMLTLGRLFAANLNINWQAIYDPSHYNKLSLPTYPFQRKSYWIKKYNESELQSIRSEGNDPLLGVEINTPLPYKQYEYTINHNNLPQIKDNHNILHVGFFLQMLMHAVKKSLDTPFKIKVMEFVTALSISDVTSKVITLILTPRTDNHELDITFYSRDANQTSWVLNVKGCIQLQRSIELPTVDKNLLDAMQKCNDHYLGETFYNKLRERRVELGESVQLIEEVWAEEGAALARFKPHHATDTVSPGVWDTCAQLFFAALPKDFGNDKGFMVVKWKDLQYQILDDMKDLWCYAKLLNQSKDLINGQFVLFNAAGKQIASCDVIEMKPVDIKRMAEIHQAAQTKTTASDLSERDAFIQELTQKSKEEQLTALAEYVRDLLTPILNISKEELALNEPIRNYGIDSLVGMEFRAKLDAKLGVNMPMENILEGNSLTEFAKKLATLLKVGQSTVAAPEATQEKQENSYSKEKSLWLETNKHYDNAKFRLFCLPYGGGSAALYRQWQKEFPNDIAIVPIQLPGRENRIKETPIDNVDTMVDVLAEILSSELTTPFAIYGHSAGGLLAYRLAKKLIQNPDAKKANNLKDVFVAAYTAPSYLPNPWLIKCKSVLTEAGFKGLPTIAELEHCTDEQLALLIEILSIELDLKKFPELSKDKALVRMLLGKMIADLKLVESNTNTDASPLTVPIISFHGKNDDRVTLEEMQAWKQFTTDSKLYVMDGDHFFLHKDQSQTLLIQTLTSYINNERLKNPVRSKD